MCIWNRNAAAAASAMSPTPRRTAPMSVPDGQLGLAGLTTRDSLPYYDDVSEVAHPATGVTCAPGDVEPPATVQRYDTVGVRAPVSRIVHKAGGGC